jgi:hypothetical protein
LVDRERLAAAAEQFRASGLLGKPGSLSRLFDYLLSRTLADEAPKEIEIALEVFSKSPGFDVSQDAVVRVYMHKLRRRLNEFYAKAGSTAVGKLTIPKGEYRIVFETVDRPIASDDMAPDMPSGTPVLHRWPWSRLAVALLAGVIIGGAIAWLAMRSGQDTQLRALRSNPIWAPLLDDDVPITIVVGDYFLLGEIDDSGAVRRLVREFYINSRSDFLEYAELDPRFVHKYRNLSLTYLPTASAFTIQDIAPVLGRGKRVSVTLMSNFDVSLLKSTHVIYVGFVSGLGVLGDPVFAVSRISPGGSFDELVDSETNTTYLSTAMPLQGGDQSYLDYAYLSSFEGPSGHRVLVIAGTRDTGVRQMGEILTQVETLDELTRRAGNATQFESLYEVYGVGHASLRAKLLFATPIHAVNAWDSLH